MKPTRKETIQRLIKDYLIYLRLKESNPRRAAVHLADCEVSMKILEKFYGFTELR